MAENEKDRGRQRVQFLSGLRYVGYGEGEGDLIGN